MALAWSRQGRRNCCWLLKWTSMIGKREGELLLISEVNLVSDKTTWVVDCGASFHLIPDQICFSSYRVRSWLCEGGEWTSMSMCFTTSSGYRLVLENVWHVPEVRLNMISAGRVDHEGYTDSFWNNILKICKGNLIVVWDRKINTLYLMHAPLCREEVKVATVTTGELWHKRLCHMSENGMQKLVNDNIIPEVKSVQLDNCTENLADK